MIPRWIELYKDKALGGDSGTETFPLKRNWQILELLLNVRSQNGAASNASDGGDGTAADRTLKTVESSLTKIEVKSGSASFKNYTGEMCRHFSTYRNGKLPPTLHPQCAGGTWDGNNDPTLGWQEMMFPINFNVPSDPYGDITKVVLPAPLYDSLDLVLEYDFYIDGDHGFVTAGTTHVFNLYALVIPKEPKEEMLRKRILVETKKQDYTTVASGDEPFDLTLSPDRFLRQLMVHCYETPSGGTGIAEGVDISDLDLRIDGDTVWAGKWGDLQAMNALDARLDYKKTIHTHAISTDDAIWTRIPAVEAMANIVQDTAEAEPAVVGDVVTMPTQTANDTGILQLKSQVLPAAVVFDFDVDHSLRHLQYCGVKDLDLILTNGAAGGSVQFMEQHVARPWGVD